jgi:nucleoside transporter
MGIEFFCGLIGLFALPGLAWSMSVDRSNVMWKAVIFGLLIQLTLGALVMLTPPGQAFFGYMNDIVRALLSFSDKGASFLFGDLVNPTVDLGGDVGTWRIGANFAFSVLPTIIFFSALMSILYYTGIMQKIVEFVAWIMMKVLGTSGAETLSVSSNIFVGQTEAPLVIKPFVKDMTKSELNTVMAGGFGTVAGGVMAAYVGMLSGYFPEIAGHLMTASVMSAPAAIVMSKLTYPEDNTPETRGEVRINAEENANNVIDAAASGAKTGLTLALNVGAMLLAFIALVKLGNQILARLGDQLYYLFTQASGFRAFLPGALFGLVLLVFAIARTAWTEDDTKYWIGGLGLIGVLSVIGYYILDPYSFYGSLIGFVLGVSLTLAWQTERVNRWITSLASLLIGSTIVGLLSYLAAGTDSSAIAGGVTVGLLGLLCSLFVYWKDPSLKSALTVLGVAVITGLIGAIFSGDVFSAWGFGEVGINALNALETLTLQKLFGYVFSVLAFLMGVPWQDLMQVGQLIGNKIVVNEFVAFLEYQQLAKAGELTYRSKVIVTYALCGFANFSSIAIQIGGIGGIAPSREHDLADLGLRAMISGALASFQTAAVAGVMVGIADYWDIGLATIG